MVAVAGRRGAREQSEGEQRAAAEPRAASDVLRRYRAHGFSTRCPGRPPRGDATAERARHAKRRHIDGSPGRAAPNLPPVRSSPDPISTRDRFCRRATSSEPCGPVQQASPHFREAAAHGAIPPLHLREAPVPRHEAPLPARGACRPARGACRQPVELPCPLVELVGGSRSLSARWRLVERARGAPFRGRPRRFPQAFQRFARRASMLPAALDELHPQRNGLGRGLRRAWTDGADPSPERDGGDLRENERFPAGGGQLRGARDKPSEPSGELPAAEDHVRWRRQGFAAPTSHRRLGQALPELVRRRRSWLRDRLVEAGEDAAAHHRGR